jgi:hypothetical protein
MLNNNMIPARAVQDREPEFHAKTQCGEFRAKTQRGRKDAKKTSEQSQIVFSICIGILCVSDFLCVFA